MDAAGPVNEFVAGKPIASVDEAVVRAIADFYAEVYARDPKRIALADTPFPGRLRRDLCFLNEVGVIDDPLAAGLDAAAARLAPEQVWVGFDYTDAVLKNFVVLPESARICAVDVESLSADRLLGTGVAKALYLWLEPARTRLLDALDARGVPDFRSYWPFVELHFHCARARRDLERGDRPLDLAAFDALLERAGS